MNIDVSGNGLIEIVNSDFIKCGCDCENGCGGVAYIILGASSTFKVEKTRFIDNTAKYGNNIYFTCTAVDNQLVKANFDIDGKYLIEKAFYYK